MHGQCNVRFGSLAAVQNGMSALPPKADIDWRQVNVRYVPKADIIGHSINSSARMSKGNGKSIPSVLAVFVFTSSSTLLGCSTGRSSDCEFRDYQGPPRPFHSAGR
jgi:hypothetical protein